MHDLSDEELFARVQAGNDTAFRTLYKRYDRRLFAYCFRAFGDRESAEDTFQSIIMKVFEHRNSFSGGHFAGWLFTIARNETIKALKKQRPTTDLESIEYQLRTERDHVDDDVLMKEHLYKAIEQLPPEFKQPLLMKYVDGHTYDVIAERLGCSVSLAKVRVFRAKKMLKKDINPIMQEIQ